MQTHTCRLIHAGSYMWFTHHLPPPTCYLKASNEVTNTLKVGELTHNPQTHTQRPIHEFSLPTGSTTAISNCGLPLISIDFHQAFHSNMLLWFYIGTPHRSELHSIISVGLSDFLFI